MLASRIVAPIIYAEVLSLPEVSDAIGDRFFNSLTLPQGEALPAGLFYLEHAPYGNAAMGSGWAGALTIETMRWVVRFMVQDASDDAILAATEAQLKHLHNYEVDIPASGGNPPYHVYFSAQAEYPLTSFVDGGDEYRQLGTVYSVEVTSGG